MLQITDLQQEQQIMPLFRLGFRPFFLAGASFSIIALVLWSFILHQKLPFTPMGGGYWWHIHEMVFGFACAIIAGFLLTAVQNWTGARGVFGKTLMTLFSIWLAGRIVMLFPNLLGQNISILIDLAFLPATAYLLAKPIIAVKQTRNLFFIPLLLLLTIINIQLHFSLIKPEVFNLKTAGYAAVLLVTFLMSVMAGRVTPMFTANGTKTEKVLPIKALEFSTNGFIGFAMLTQLVAPLFHTHELIVATLLALASITQAIRWYRWKPWITLGTPLLWSLHFAMMFVWLGLAVLALAFVMPELPMASIWHLLTIGGMAGLILAMISRVSLGHTGRPLQPKKSMSVAFAAILLGALIRVFGPWGLPKFHLVFVDISITCWLIAFGLFVMNYGKLLMSPRADNRPG